MNNLKALAIAAAESGCASDLARFSPLKRKRGPDRVPRAGRIRGVLPPEKQTEEFQRASQTLNFVDEG
jgi:hypothetical protein